MRKLIVSIVLSMMLVFGAISAQAYIYNGDPTNYDWFGFITSDHMTGGAGTPPFGYVGLVQDGTSVNFYVKLLDANSKFVSTGAGGGYNFVFNANNVLPSELSGSSLTFGSGTIHADGTGDWQFGVYKDTGEKGNMPWPGPIQFTVANATIADVTVGQTGPVHYNIFAADIASGQTGNTGMVDVTSPVPIPPAVWLLGSGLAGLVIVRRKVRKN